MESKDIIRELSREFSRDDIHFRPGSTFGDDDNKKGKPLAYIDARHVMDRLDDVVGAENWQDEYSKCGNVTICKLSIRINGEWITKSDGAPDTNMEGEKGGISDALKRASVKWGVSRYLYALKFGWIPMEKKGRGFKFAKGTKYWDYLEVDNHVLGKADAIIHDIENSVRAVWGYNQKTITAIKKQDSNVYAKIEAAKDKAKLIPSPSGLEAG